MGNICQRDLATEEAVRELFETLDKDKSGFLDEKEFAKLGRELWKERKKYGISSTATRHHQFMKQCFAAGRC